MIFPSNRPLFNRNYLLALVWLLPIAIVLLNRSTPPDEPEAERLSQQHLWQPSEIYRTQIYLPFDSGLTATQQSPQQLVLLGLRQRLNEPDLRAFVQQRGWSVELLNSSLYIQIQLSSTKKQSGLDLQQFIEELHELPTLNWKTEISKLNAQSYLASNSARQKALNALFPDEPAPLNPNLYADTVQGPVLILQLASDRPEQLEFNRSTRLSKLQQINGTAQIYAEKSALIDLWRLPAPASTSEYLGQQLLGILLTQRLGTHADLRFQQQLSPSGTLIVLEHSDVTPALMQEVAQPPLSAEEFELALENLKQRWQSALVQNSSTWSEVLLLYTLAPRSFQHAYIELEQQAQAITEPYLEQLQQPPEGRAYVHGPDRR